MERGNEWSVRVANGIGKRVAYYRTRADLTAAMLSDRCGELGLPLDRNVIAKLENGHRQSVTVDEVYVLAVALEIPPVLLLFGVGTEETASILPEWEVTPWHALRWFCGFSTFPQPGREDVLTDWIPGTGPAAAITAYRFNEVAAQEAMTARDRMISYERMAEAASSDTERRAYQAAAERELEAERRVLDAGKQMRDMAAGKGYLPPVPIGMYEVFDGPQPGRPRRIAAGAVQQDEPGAPHEVHHDRTARRA
jgi:transcriptional regulator with XRE-family HTH domain